MPAVLPEHIKELCAQDAAPLEDCLFIDARAFRNAMGQFATGVVVISTEVDGQAHAMTANAFMSGSLEPPLILVSVAQTARMFGRIVASERFAVSVLGAAQQALSDHFAGRLDQNADKNAADRAVPVFERLDGLPVIADALVQVSTRLQHSYPCGDHTLFVGRVTGLRQAGLRQAGLRQAGLQQAPSVQQTTQAQPLIFQAGQYQALAVRGEEGA